MAIDSGKKDKEPDLEEVIEDLERKVERLKVLYEQYFMGIERLEPQTARKEVARKIIEFTQLQIRNTALRYRFNALNQKWGVYITYWNRVLREIENGTYYRSVARVGREALRKGQDIPDEVLRAMPERMRAGIMKQRALLAEKDKREAARRGKDGGQAAAPAQAQAPAVSPRPSAAVGAEEAKIFDANMSFDEAFDNLFDSLAPVPAKTPPPPAAEAPRVPPQRKPPAAPPPRAASSAPPPPTSAPRRPLPPGMDEDKTQELYKKYVQAKKLVGEDVSSVKYEHIVATINKQAPKILEQHKAKGVEFQVVVKDNKVILKAIPKK